MYFLKHCHLSLLYCWEKCHYLRLKFHYGKHIKYKTDWFCYNMVIINYHQRYPIPCPHSKLWVCIMTIIGKIGHVITGRHCHKDWSLLYKTWSGSIEHVCMQWPIPLPSASWGLHEDYRHAEGKWLGNYIYNLNVPCPLTSLNFNGSKWPHKV